MMRVTTQMVNESAKRAGLPLMQDSLLNHLNGSGDGGSLVDALSEKSKKQGAAMAATKYEKTEKAANNLADQLQRFALSGSGNIFEKIKGSEDKTELYDGVAALAENYNRLLDAMKQNTGTMDSFYRQSLKEIASDSREALAGIGITLDGSGKMKVDGEKLKSVPGETLEKVLGSDSEFVSKLAFLVPRIADNASAAVESVSGTYLPGGGMAGDYMNSRYDFRG